MWIKLHNWDLNNSHVSPDILTINILKGMRWTKHVASTGRIQIISKL
jgi:hypothetical protein